MIGLRMHTLFVFFFNDTATTEIYTLSLHDALPLSPPPQSRLVRRRAVRRSRSANHCRRRTPPPSPGPDCTKLRRSVLRTRLFQRDHSCACLGRDDLA